jgi:hypothetical protein
MGLRRRVKLIISARVAKSLGLGGGIGTLPGRPKGISEAIVSTSLTRTWSVRIGSTLPLAPYWPVAPRLLTLPVACLRQFAGPPPGSLHAIMGDEDRTMKSVKGGMTLAKGKKPASTHRAISTLLNVFMAAPALRCAPTTSWYISCSCGPCGPKRHRPLVQTTR